MANYRDAKKMTTVRLSKHTKELAEGRSHLEP